MKKYILIGLLLTAPVWADDKKQEKPKTEKKEIKPEKEEPKDETKSEEDPIKAIVNLMREAESRLNDVDENIDENQRKIVEAMKFGDKIQTSLGDLIKQLEDKMTQQSENSGQSGQSKSSKSKQDQSKKNDSEKSSNGKSKAQMEREKKDEEKRKGSNPGPNKRENTATNTGNNESGKSPGDNPGKQGELNSKKEDNEKWGNLPAKLHEDAAKARKAPIPEKWREAIEQFRKTTVD